MRLNADLNEPVIVHGGRLDWVASPAAGVERKMLYREGEEVARATSIVRYAPDSAFPRHVHGGGEEILVLAGTFQDEHGDYPAGAYFRNPPGTAHTPAAAEGCTIFVRLWQFRAEDHAQVVRQPGEGEAAPLRRGAVEALTLFDDGAERILIEEWVAGVVVEVANERGLEVLVLEGSLVAGDEALAPQSWCRLPSGQRLQAQVGPRGARVWIRDAPLQHPDVLAMPA